MSLFKKPDDPAGITFMVRGDAGTGKTRFALGVKRVTNLPCAYIGTDRGAQFYKDDPEVGGFLQVETRDPKVIESAIKELREDWGKTFGAVVVDTITDLWTAEQKTFEKVKRKGDSEIKFIPIGSWRPMREAHEQKLRDLQELPVHTFLICEEKPVYERSGSGEDAELKEVGSREDSDKKDSYVSDVRLRFYTERGRFYAEVLKDRTGTFPMGEVVEDPRVEMWIKGRARQTVKPAAPAKAAEPSADDLAAFDAMASQFIDYVRAIKAKTHWANWRKKHADDLARLWALMPDGDLKAELVEVCKEKKAQFENGKGAEEGATA